MYSSSGGISRWGHLTAGGRGVVVGDDGCSSSDGINRWSHLTADGRGVVTVVGDGGCSSSGGISRWVTSLLTDAVLSAIIGGSCHKYHFYRDKHKHVFVAPKVCLPRHKFCRDKHTFVPTKAIFVATKICLSRQNTSFVTTKVCLPLQKKMSRQK